MNAKLKWNSNYPDKKILRKEINFMLEAFMEVLLKEIVVSEIEMIYFKGSAQKNWDSPIDYVPELSDIDIHILFSNDSSTFVYFGTINKALDIQSKIEKIYLSKVKNPFHIPRPQLMVLNHLLKEKDFILTPKRAIKLLYGKVYSDPDYSDDDRIKSIDRNRILCEEKFLLEFPLKVIDKPAKYLWMSLKDLVWHVSPLGARVLHILVVKTEEAWSMNRSQIVSLLKEMGETKLSKDYSEFYLNGWDYFLSNYKDTKAGSKSIISGINALKRGIEIAKS